MNFSKLFSAARNSNSRTSC